MSTAPASARLPERRRMLAAFFWGAVALAGAVLATPVVGFFLGPLLRKQPRPVVKLGALSDFPTDRPRRVQFTLRQRDGWVTSSGLRAAWVVRLGTEVMVFDPRCTHLGCAYHWHAKTGQFLCPCHNGVYDREGRVVSGPPPRPLDTYPTRVEGGALYVVPVPQRRT